MVFIYFEIKDVLFNVLFVCLEMCLVVVIGDDFFVDVDVYDQLQYVWNVLVVWGVVYLVDCMVLCQFKVFECISVLMWVYCEGLFGGMLQLLEINLVWYIDVDWLLFYFGWVLVSLLEIMLEVMVVQFDQCQVLQQVVFDLFWKGIQC